VLLGVLLPCAMSYAEGTHHTFVYNNTVSIKTIRGIGAVLNMLQMIIIIVVLKNILLK
jgi:hypothetical protein